MAHADATTLQRLLPLLRQLREIRELREKSPGSFYLGNSAFLHFHAEDGGLLADLKRPRGGGFERFAVDTPIGQRKLFDEARRRVARQDDE